MSSKRQLRERISGWFYCGFCWGGCRYLEPKSTLRAALPSLITAAVAGATKAAAAA
jgi:hypothetical protein